MLDPNTAKLRNRCLMRANGRRRYYSMMHSYLAASECLLVAIIFALRAYGRKQRHEYYMIP